MNALDPCDLYSRCFKAQQNGQVRSHATTHLKFINILMKIFEDFVWFRNPELRLVHIFTHTEQQSPIEMKKWARHNWVSVLYLLNKLSQLEIPRRQQ